MADLNISKSLTFSEPSKIQDGEINFVSFKPSGGAVFGPNDSVNIKVSSNNQFLVMDRSYLKFTLKTAATSTLHPQGASAIISSVSDTVGGLQLPLIRDWFINRHLELQTSTNEKKAVCAIGEQFSGTGTTGVATTAGASISVCLPVPTSLQSEKLLPLAVINSGWQVNYMLNAASRVVATGEYTIEDVELVCAMLTPEQSYLAEVAKGLASGASLKIPLQLTKTITTSVSTALQQTLLLQVGYMSSINSISVVARESEMVNSVKIADYYLSLDGKRYPVNKHITSGPESLYQMLAGYSTSISSIAPVNANHSFQHYTFKTNGDFSSGIPTANGSVELNLTFSSAPSGTVVSLLNYDALLIISQNSVNLLVDV